MYTQPWTQVISGHAAASNAKPSLVGRVIYNSPPIGRSLKSIKGGKSIELPSEFCMITLAILSEEDDTNSEEDDTNSEEDDTNSEEDDSGEINHSSKKPRLE